jgi:hypothetical protein
LVTSRLRFLAVFFHADLSFVVIGFIAKPVLYHIKRAERLGGGRGLKIGESKGRDGFARPASKNAVDL